MPAADVPPCSRLRGVLIFEQNSALASTPCAFRFQTGSGAMIPSISNTVQNFLSGALESISPAAPGRVFDLKCRSCGFFWSHRCVEIGFPGRILVGF